MVIATHLQLVIKMNLKKKKKNSYDTRMFFTNLVQGFVFELLKKYTNRIKILF